LKNNKRILGVLIKITVQTIHMQCERLIKMIKTWYLHVREETMAPARMVAFMEEHAENCEVCLQDPDLQDEIAKITELVLPESKIPKAVRLKSDDDIDDADIDVDDKDDDEVVEDEETDETPDEDEDVDVDEEEEFDIDDEI